MNRVKGRKGKEKRKGRKDIGWRPFSSSTSFIFPYYKYLTKFSNVDRRKFLKLQRSTIYIVKRGDAIRTGSFFFVNRVMRNGNNLPTRVLSK